VYARHGDLLLKRFQEEEDLHVYFLIDCSRSMGFGNPPKFDLARQVTAALAYIALSNLDRIGIIAYSQEIIADFPLTRGKDRILSLLRFLEKLEPQGTDTNLGRIVNSFVLRPQRRGLAVVISDLFDPNGYERGLDLLRHRTYEPHLVQIHDPAEARPQMLGEIELVDAETDSVRKVTITERALREYRKVFDSFQAGVAGYGKKYGLGCTQTTNEVDFEDLILRMMRTAGAVS
jgi:uncharacterized protein (DUF58 family)